MQREILLFTPGLVPYRDAWGWQQQTAAAVREGGPETLAVLQHPAVFTLGRRAREDSLLWDRETLARMGAEVVECDRGGDVTFHGPGQLVAYPILDLRARGIGAADYVRMLEEVMLRTVARFGVLAARRPGLPGIWANGEKLGAIGVRVQGGVSTHGLALNVDPDLARFDAIVPCGLEGMTVTSIAQALGTPIDFAAVEAAFLEVFSAVFDSSLQPARIPLSLTLSPEGRGDLGGRRGVAKAGTHGR